MAVDELPIGPVATVSPTRKTRVFISFDYDRDRDLKTLLVGQAKHRDSPFFIDDWSIKYASRGWRTEARDRIGRADHVIVICGHNTHRAVGVTAELKTPREASTPTSCFDGARTAGFADLVGRASGSRCFPARGPTYAR